MRFRGSWENSCRIISADKRRENRNLFLIEWCNGFIGCYFRLRATEAPLTFVRQKNGFLAKKEARRKNCSISRLAELIDIFTLSVSSIVCCDKWDLDSKVDSYQFFVDENFMNRIYIAYRVIRNHATNRAQRQIPSCVIWCDVRDAKVLALAPYAKLFPLEV